MKIYYYANHIYQLSYALPIYRKLGGTFIVNSLKKFYHFKKYLRNMQNSSDKKTFLNTPQIILKNPEKKFLDLEGIIISFSNSWIKCNREKCILIFLEHGSSDKKFGADPKAKTKEKLLNFDYIFLMGPKNKQKILEMNLDIPENKFIKIGALRFDDFVNGKYDKNAILNRLKIKDKTRKNVLYAPTWRFGGGTFKKFAKPFARKITEKYNLIIRPHYHDAHRIPQIKIWAKLNSIKHLYFSDPSNLANADTMQDFAVSDILLSDTSAVLYEYLITGNPIIIIKTEFDRLHQMKDEMNIMQNADIFDGKQDINALIAENLKFRKYEKKYKIMLKHCFYHYDGTASENAVNFLKTIYKGKFGDKNDS